MQSFTWFPPATLKLRFVKLYAIAKSILEIEEIDDDEEEGKISVSSSQA